MHLQVSKRTAETPFNADQDIDYFIENHNWYGERVRQFYHKRNFYLDVGMVRKLPLKDSISQEMMHFLACITPLTF